MFSDKGIVLIIDDENGRPTQRLLDDSISSIVRHPNEVTSADLRRAKLVLVDFKLDNWPERNDQDTPSLMPRDGIALIAVLRSNLAASAAAPTAFALNSGMLSALCGPGASEGREYAIAKSIDIDWVFAKGGKRADFSAAVASLAAAVASLPTKWPASSKTKARIHSLLAVPARPRWKQSAIEGIDRSAPPHDILIANGSGVAILRWLLHSILPFPTFLLSERYLAARLRIEPHSLSEALKGKEGKRIRNSLSSFEYRGILGQFAGTRWWRAGIEYWIWENTRGNAFDQQAIEKLVCSKLSKNLKFSSLSNPVISLDAALRPSEKLINLTGAIEIKPDGWPPYADAAWISSDLVDEPEFVALVPQSERNKL